MASDDDPVTVVVAFSRNTSEIGQEKTLPRSQAKAWVAEGRARYAAAPGTTTEQQETPMAAATGGDTSAASSGDAEPRTGPRRGGSRQASAAKPVEPAAEPATDTTGET